MKLWMLDNGVFSRLAAALKGDVIRKANIIFLAEAVVEEATRGHPLSPERMLLSAVDGDVPIVGRVQLPIESDGFRMLVQHLRPDEDVASRDYGEHESIAICRTERTDLVFTSLDKLAIRLALSELGSGRVAYPYEFAESLRRHGAISPAAHGRFLEQIRRACPMVPIPWTP